MAKLLFDPLKNEPETIKKRYSKLRKRAKTSYKDAGKLFCLYCLNYDHKAAKACPCNDCPLWASNRKAFK